MTDQQTKAWAWAWSEPSNSPTTASGKDLDLWAYLYGVTRAPLETDLCLRARLYERVSAPPKRETMADDGTFTFTLTATGDTPRIMPGDLPAKWRSAAARALGSYSTSTEPKGEALSLLNCAADLEAALKAQADAIKATAAPLKKPASRPKKK